MSSKIFLVVKLLSICVIYVSSTNGCVSTSGYKDNGVWEVEGSISIVNRYLSDSLEQGKSRIKINTYDKYTGKRPDFFWTFIYGDALKGSTKKMHKGTSIFEIDIPYGECNILVWITNKNSAQSLNKLVTIPGEIVEIKAEIGGVSID